MKVLVVSILVVAFVAGPIANAHEAEQPRQRLEYEQNTVDVVNEVGPSVVAVNISVDGEQTLMPMDDGDHQAGGSGFVVDRDGSIITNFHVVAPVLADATDDALEVAGEASLTISYLGSPEEEYAVEVIGANPDFDLALLRPVDQDAVPEVSPIPFADSDAVAVGEQAIAIGNPFGLHSSVTAGIVSAVERERPGIAGIEIPYVQTDTAINPGNSGGPLLNSSGQVIGINNAVMGDPAGTFAGVGLAVPINLLEDAMDELLAGGLSGFAAAAAEIPDKPRLGLEVSLSVADYPAALRDDLEFPEHGVVVTGVAPGGPADQAGIRGPDDMVTVGPRPFPVGMDVITAIDGERVNRAVDLQRVVLEHGQGDVVVLDIWRDGEKREVEVELQVVEDQN